jgi:hypothetical protein
MLVPLEVPARASFDRRLRCCRARRRPLWWRNQTFKNRFCQSIARRSIDSQNKNIRMREMSRSALQAALTPTGRCRVRLLCRRRRHRNDNESRKRSGNGNETNRTRQIINLLRRKNTHALPSAAIARHVGTATTTDDRLSPFCFASSFASSLTLAFVARSSSATIASRFARTFAYDDCDCFANKD